MTSGSVPTTPNMQQEDAGELTSVFPQIANSMTVATSINKARDANHEIMKKNSPSTGGEKRWKIWKY